MNTPGPAQTSRLPAARNVGDRADKNVCATWPTIEEARSFLRLGTGKGIKIAVLDSGIETGHPLLSSLGLTDDLAIVESGFQIATVPGQGRDVFGHGTAIAGILHEVAPEAQIGSFRVLGEQLRSRTLIIREAARQALERGYHILNCSFGCGREDQVLIYKDWIDEAYVRGRHIVASCNNQDFMKREWPGHFPSVVTVNFTAARQPEDFFCRLGRMVEFAARGEDVEVAWLGGGRKKVTGSSFAVPHVTALLARLLSCCPGLSPVQAKALLHQLATPWDG
ncbi:MAG TPA: S8 family serine peptidase [Candidatus Binatia bacterium]|jgi:subtilisin family serine protease|nr:S8 family serine peptidase [Candidatus Binatia bacterium]